MKLYRRTKSFDDGMMSASYMTHEASPADLISAGHDTEITPLVVDKPGIYIVIGPVSDGGSET